MEKLLIEQLISRVHLLTLIKPIDQACLDFYNELRKTTNENMTLVTELLRNYQTKDAEGDAVKFGLLYYLESHNKEVSVL